MNHKDYSLNYIKQQLELLSDAAILDAERSFNLYKAIGKNKKIIDEAGFGNYFGLCQRAFLFQSIVSVVSIFEKPSKKYPTATIVEIVNRLRDEQQELSQVDTSRLAEITECHSRYNKLLEFEMSGDFRESAKILADFLETLIPPEQAEYWQSLRDIRDKKLAHREIIKEFESKVTGEHFDKMLANARLAVNTIGMAYFNGYHVPIDNLKDYQEFACLLDALSPDHRD